MLYVIRKLYKLCIQVISVFSTAMTISFLLKLFGITRWPWRFVLIPVWLIIIFSFSWAATCFLVINYQVYHEMKMKLRREKYGVDIKGTVTDNIDKPLVDIKESDSALKE